MSGISIDEIAAFVAQEGSAYEDVNGLPATVVKELQSETDQVTNQFNEIDVVRDSAVSAEHHKLSTLTEELLNVVQYQYFEQNEIKKISARDSWDIWDSPDASETEFPLTEANRPKVEEVMDPTKFMTTFKEIVKLPSITELSITSVKSAKRISIDKPDDKMEDRGYFVDPLTGSLDKEEFEAEKIEELPAVSSSSSESSTTSSESAIILQVHEDEGILIAIEDIDRRDHALQPERPDEDLIEKEMAAFLEEICHVPEEVLEIRLSELLRQQHAEEKSKRLVQDFLDSLIGRVVYEVEYIDPITILRRNLDKSKLFDKIVQLVVDLRVEQRLGEILNRKTAEHYRRKKAFRNITEVNVDHIQEEMQKFHQQVDILDILLGYELDAAQNKLFIENKLQHELKDLTDLVNGEMENFEALVHKTFIRPEATERYISAIITLIRRLRNQRNEVTEFRRDLIFKQSMIAQLNEDLDKLEHLGEGLYLSEYNHRLTETIGLTKLLDEKEFQTGVMRKRCHEALHTVTHMMENITMEKSLVSIHQEQMYKVELKKAKLREELYHLKIQHLNMMQETTQIHFQGGLIGKPSILDDYDNIAAQIPMVRNRIENLRSVYENLSIKVKFLGMRCGNI